MNLLLRNEIIVSYYQKKLLINMGKKIANLGLQLMKISVQCGVKSKLLDLDYRLVF